MGQWLQFSPCNMLNFICLRMLSFTGIHKQTTKAMVLELTPLLVWGCL